MIDHTRLIFMIQFAVSIDAYPHTENQPYIFTHSQDIPDLSF